MAAYSNERIAAIVVGILYRKFTEITVYSLSQRIYIIQQLYYTVSKLHFPYTYL